MANELAKEGIRVSPTGVRGVLVRHDLNTMAKRLKTLEAKVARLILTEHQLAALERRRTPTSKRMASSMAPVPATAAPRTPSTSAR